MKKEACGNFEKFFKLELKSQGSYNLYKDNYEKIYEKYYKKACEEFKQDFDTFQENCPDLKHVINN